MNILILGCGWVGESFAEYMLAKGANVWVTNRSPEKVKHFTRLGYHAHVLDLDAAATVVDFPSHFDYVLNSIPATSKYSTEVLEQRFSNLQKLLQSIDYRKHIFLSSVGVYPDMNGDFDETHTDGLNSRLRRAEELMEVLSHTVIFRLGGLFGRNRVFAKYFSNKVCATGDQLANFVHVDDVVRFLYRGFKNLESGVFNLVCPTHPTKERVIRSSAAKYGFDLPSSFEPQDSFQKRVLSDKILAVINQQFIYESPLDF